MRYSEILNEESNVQKMHSREIIDHFKDVYPITKQLKSAERGMEIKRIFELPMTHASTDIMAGDFLHGLMPDDSIGMLEWPRGSEYTLGVDSQATLDRIKKMIGDIHHTKGQQEKNQARIDKRKEMLQKPEYQPGSYVYHTQLKLIGQITGATKAGKLKVDPVVHLEGGHVPGRAVDPKILKPVSEDMVQKLQNGEMSKWKALKKLAPGSHRHLTAPEDQR